MIEHKFYEHGDFGSLHQVRISSSTMEIVIDFWGQGWFGLSVFDFEKDVFILNELLKPTEKKKKESVIKKMESYLSEFNISWYTSK